MFRYAYYCVSTSMVASKQWTLYNPRSHPARSRRSTYFVHDENKRYFTGRKSLPAGVSWCYESIEIAKAAAFPRLDPRSNC